MKTKFFEIITKPTIDAFCRGKTTKRKIVSEEWLELELQVISNNPDVERYTYKQI